MKEEQGEERRKKKQVVQEEEEMQGRHADLVRRYWKWESEDKRGKKGEERVLSKDILRPAAARDLPGQGLHPPGTAVCSSSFLSLTCFQHYEDVGARVSL